MVCVSLQRVIYVFILAAVSLWMGALWLSFKLVRVDIFGPASRNPAAAGANRRQPDAWHSASARPDVPAASASAPRRVTH